MRIKDFDFRLIILLIFLSAGSIFSSVPGSLLSSQDDSLKTRGAFYTDEYPNLFKTILGKSDQQIDAKINFTFQQLFYGDDSIQRVYYPVKDDMAYIEDVNNQDVRTEGMSYGMMIAVQMNKKDEFDRLWKWAKTYMQFQEGQRKNYFAWHCKTNGTKIDSGSASDGEEWFAMSLLFASARWGNGDGIYNYQDEAQKILDAMLGKKEDSDSRFDVTNMFNKKNKLVVFVPDGFGNKFTDPSYHLPHYYELWGMWADKNNKFWFEAADASREFLKKAANPSTGLMPDYANFDGSPLDLWKGGHNNFMYDAWRIASNIAIDYTWFAKDNWEVEECNKLLNFFYSQGIGKYHGLLTLEGKALPGSEHNKGLIAMNATACLASTNDNRKEFLEEFWNTPIPEGRYRYYDGMLYMLSMLEVTGNFRIYKIK